MIGLDQERITDKIDSKNSIKKLSQYDVILESLVLRLEELTGFRNLLVHQYGRVDTQ